MADLEYLHFTTRKKFRSWLEKNHAASKGIWMVFFKKHTRKENISYDEAVEEALCFGWIDSTKRRIDEERYVYKFTPRMNIHLWSDSNKIRAARLFSEGRMTDAGLRKIDVYLETGKVYWEKSDDPVGKIIEAGLNENQLAELQKNEPAWTNFDNLSPSEKRNYIGWINSAKKEETIQRRLDEAIRLLKENKKLGMK